MPDVEVPAPARLARLRALTASLVPLLIGAVAFRIVVGGRILLPTNVGWIRAEDPSQHYLGWAFFRQGPWTWPYGANPDWGLEFSNSILYTDSIPLLAFFFKPFSPLLPHPFQYLGIWVLLCFMLQAWFGWKIAGRYTRSGVLRALASGLLVFAPPMIFRLIGHWSLMGQWTILAALFLWLTPDGRRRTMWWSLLTATTALVHMYLLLMVVLLWAATWVTGAIWQAGSWKAHLAQAAAVPAAMLAALWQAGFFLVREGKAGGAYGLFGLNLNSLFDPAGWSYVLPPLGSRPGSYEGFSYLGLGGLVLVAAAIPAAVRLRRQGALRFQARWIPLALLLLALIPLAVSNHVGVGSRQFVYRMPPLLVPVGDMVRASGRLFWPVFYTIVVAALAVVIRGYRTRTATIVLACALLIQATDTASGWLHVNPSLSLKARTWHSPLTHQFWFDAPSLYRKIRLIPPRNRGLNWREISDYAQRHGMATDATYLARVDHARHRMLFERTERMLLEGGFEADSIYVLLGSNARRVPCVVDPRTDLLAIIDGMWVLAPGWKRRFGNRYSELPHHPCPTGAPETMDFGIDGSGLALLGTGWANPEDWGTWNAGDRSALNVHVDPGAPTLELDVDAFVPPGAPALDVAVAVDGVPADTWHFDEDHDEGWRQLALPDVGEARRRVRVTFAYSVTRAPSDWGPSSDTRGLALALRRARVVHATPGAR